MRSRALRAAATAAAVGLAVANCGRSQATFSKCEVVVTAPWGSGQGEVGHGTWRWPGVAEFAGTTAPEDAIECSAGFWVADSANGRAVLFDRSGRWVHNAVMPVPGRIHGEPLLLALSRAGDLFVIERGPRGEVAPDAYENPGLAVFGPGGDLLSSTRDVPWAPGKPPEPLWARNVVALSAGPRDAYICLKSRDAKRLGVFRVSRDRQQMEFVGAPPQSPLSVRCAAFGWAGDEPVLHCVAGSGTGGDGAQTVHRLRWTITQADGTAVAEHPFELRSRAEMLGLVGFGATAGGDLYLTKLDWTRDAKGRYWYKDIRTSVVVLRGVDEAVLEQPAEELEQMAKDAGVPQWTDRYYLRVSAAGDLLVGFICDDSFRLVRYTRGPAGG